MMERHFAGSNFPIRPLGLGGIVVPDGSPDWVTQSDFQDLLEVCTAELGVHYLDSALMYQLSEQEVGKFLKRKGSAFRSQLIVGSKPHYRHVEGTPYEGLTRSVIEKQIDACLLKMQTDYLDIYWMHGVGAKTPFEATMEGFDAVVIAGKCRTFGISNVSADQISSIVQICESRGFAKPAAVQNEFHLLNSSEQVDVLSICRKFGIAFTAFSPLATGILAGRYRLGQALPDGSRWKTWTKWRAFPSYWNERGFAAVEGLSKLAGQWGHDLPTVALSWLFGHPDVSMTLLGPRKVAHLDAVRKAIALELSADQRQQIEALSLN